MIIRNELLNELLKFKDTELIKVITGIRRSGKSKLLEMYQNHLVNNEVPQEQIIYINFEDFDNRKLLDAEELYSFIKSRLCPEKKMYILLDEIQMVENWQRVVNSLRLSELNDITITGSNAKMLSGELATILAGRYVEIKVYPLSFKEFLTFKKIENSDYRKLPKLYQEYVRFGGFPAVVLAKENIKDAILTGIYDTVLLNDVGERSGIREPMVLKMLTKFLASNIGQTVNPTKLANTLVSAKIKTSVPTVSSYLENIENGYLFYHADKIDIRGKEYLRAKGKYFIADLGLRSVALGKKKINRGSVLENVVYLELLRRGYAIDVGQIDSDHEIDFIARQGAEILYIQVAYELPANSRRETDNLLRIADNYHKIVITEVIADQDIIDGIPIVNVIDWLLESS